MAQPLASLGTPPAREPDETLATGLSALDAYGMWTTLRLADEFLMDGRCDDAGQLVGFLEHVAFHATPPVQRRLQRARANLHGTLAVLNALATPDLA